MTSAIVTRLGHLPWTPGGHPLEQKRVGEDRHVVGLKFAPGFEDPNWCTRSHVLIVTEGVLSVDVEDGTLTLRAGDAIRLPRGTGHRAANRGTEDVVLVAVSDITFD